MRLVKKKKPRGPGGRPTFFRGKSMNIHTETPEYTKVPPPTTILLTRKARKKLDTRCKELTREFGSMVSRNVVIEALIRLYGQKLTLAQIERADRDDVI